MAISGIQNSQYLSQVFQASPTNPSSATAAGNGSVGRAGNSAFASALMNALSQSGITVGSASNGTTTPSGGASQSPQQALQAFMQNLFAALHAQSAGSSGQPGADGDNDGSAAGAAGAMGGHHGGIGKMEANLQSLIQQLSSGASASPVDASLQQSFQNLAGAQGSNQASLTSFLQSLSQNLQGVGMTGNIVNSQG